ncbi:hypothetical protein, partial [Pseudozobellia sp. WGM2]|uniref:hypothetical protein n=1 Tax=Pseudozobellia sp. WGM2 TaxID=2787625 RepID=UPI001ADF9036
MSYIVEKIIDQLIDLEIEFGVEKEKLIIYNSLDLIPTSLLVEIKKNKKKLIDFLIETSNDNLSIPSAPTSRDNGYPISDAQRRIWVLSQFRGG